MTYDSCRSRLKSATPARAEAVREEMVKSEDEFVGAVDEAMSKMKAVVDNGDALRCLSDLVAIQLSYHKVCNCVSPIERDGSFIRPIARD